jgi:hypothetical protein
MREPLPSGAGRIDNISTRLSALHDPAKLVMRYGRALRSYLGALIRDWDAADDVSQDLLVQILEKGLARKAPGRGRFRDYLKAVARNVAVDYLHRKKGPVRHGVDLTQIPVPAERAAAADQEWLAAWRACILETSWTALELHEYQHPGACCHRVLRLAAEFPQEDSARLAARLSQQLGRCVRPEAFRKQLSRARRLFARLVLDEVRSTLEQPSPQRLVEELTEVGLRQYVLPYLPPDWRQLFQTGSA